MPYRRLPNTDQARIRAMEKLLEKNWNDLCFRNGGVFEYHIKDQRLAKPFQTIE